LQDAVLQVHDRFVIHTPGGALSFPSPYPWCTFDYEGFCLSLYERTTADFIQATVEGIDGNRVMTSCGSFEGEFIVDATGWRGVLSAGSKEESSVSTRALNFGIECLLPAAQITAIDRSALHFWYDREILSKGVGWAFPRDGEISVGVGTYGRSRPLREPISRMTGRLGSQPNGVHGTYFPYRLSDPVVENVFVVGDAAGMCIALTGEGIRPAMFFGEVCGQIIRRGLDRGLSVDQCLREYLDFVQSRRRFFDIFTAVQMILTQLPVWAVVWIARTLSKEHWRTWLFKTYWGLTEPWKISPASDRVVP
jgi:flavin-dependent dehydrogenase